MSVFQTVKANVTARQVAEMYGLKVNQNGMACCPSHDDKSPSMKLDERYYCFGCGVTGDAVDLTAQLLGLASKDAALRLAVDFGISIPEKPSVQKRLAPQVRPRPDPQKEAARWISHAESVLIDYLWLLRDWEKKYAPQSMDEEWHPLFCEALDQKDRVEYLLDELMLCSKDQFLEMKNSYGKEVESIEKRLERYAGRNDAEDQRNPGVLGENREGICPSDQSELCGSDGTGFSAGRGAVLEYPDRARGHRKGTRMVSR